MAGRLDSAISAGALQVLADRQAIEDVSVRYAAALDNRDWWALEVCFVPQAVYEHPGGRLSGFPAILDRVRSALAPLSRTQHLLGNFHVEVDGNQACAACHFQAQHLRRGIKGTYTISGTYADRLLRTAAGWQIEERRQTYCWTAGDRAVISRAPARGRA